MINWMLWKKTNYTGKDNIESDFSIIFTKK
jgi:hypothetical protein